MPAPPIQIEVHLLPTWDGKIDSRFPQGFMDGSGITIDYEHEPAEWDHAELVYKIAKAEGWTQEKAQEEVRRDRRQLELPV